MNTDYADSHERHWADAEHLLDGRRWANADHLYGMAAECGLKRLMLAFGMIFDAAKNSPEKRADKQHADKIWVQYETYRSGSPQGAGYTLTANNPFDDWQAEQRYAHRSHFDQARAESHRAGAQTVRSLLTRAQLDGIVQ